MFKNILITIFVLQILCGCSKLLDKQPVTQLVTKTDSTSITATDAENLMLGVYNSEIGYSYGLEFNVLDRITNGDVRSDNCYAGGDNPDNISAGYTLEGNDIKSRRFEAMSFIAPFAVAAMVDSKNQSWLNSLWTYIMNFDINQFDYYGNTIKMINMIILSGNYWAPIR